MWGFLFLLGLITFDSAPVHFHALRSLFLIYTGSFLPQPYLRNDCLIFSRALVLGEFL